MGNPMIVPKQSAHHLERIFWSGGFFHPTWCVRIIQRIARRRFVSFDEISARIVPWYERKYGYPRHLLFQHGINRQLGHWMPMGGVLGGIPWNRFRGGRAPLWCRLDERGRRVDSQHCIYCGRGINPVWNGRRKIREACKQGICADVHRWRYGGRPGATRRGRRLYLSVSPRLMPLVAVWWYLDSYLHNRKSMNGDQKAA